MRRLAHRVSVVLLVLAATSHCLAQVPKATPKEYEDAVARLEKLSQAKEIAQSYFDVAIAVSKTIQPRLDADSLRKPIREMARDVRKSLGNDTDARRIAEVMRDVIFKKYGFKKPIAPAPIISGEGIFATYALPGVLKGKQAYCEGLSTIYFLVAEEAGLPVEIITLPVHVMCKVKGADRAVYVECTRSGQLTPTVIAQRLNGLKEAGQKSGVYLSPLSKKKLLKMHLNALAYGLIKQKAGPAPLTMKQLVRLAEVIERLSPKEPESLETAALIHYTAGDAKRALAIINRAVESAETYGAPGWMLSYYAKMQRLYRNGVEKE